LLNSWHFGGDDDGDGLVGVRGLYLSLAAWSVALDWAFGLVSFAFTLVDYLLEEKCAGCEDG
jgi:hypothetical protein